MLGHEMSAAWRRTYRRTGSRLAVKYTLQKRSTKSMRLRFASTAQNLQLAYSSPCPRRHQWPCHLSSHMGHATFIIFTESFAGRIGSSCTPMRSNKTRTKAARHIHCPVSTKNLKRGIRRRWRAWTTNSGLPYMMNVAGNSLGIGF